jgi:hypothetical protein
MAWRLTLGLGFLAPLLILYAIYHLQLHLSFALPSFANLTQGAISSQQPLLSTDDDHTFTRHIVAVGDLHGDLLNAERVLRFAGVVDDFGDWSGEVDFLVQTGDIIDRYVPSPTSSSTCI